jgi:branched-chain amino acid transport system permease protein
MTVTEDSAAAPDEPLAPDGPPKVVGKGFAPRQIALSVLMLALLGIALYLPQYYDAFRVRQLSNVLCFSMAVLGLAILTGFNGQISVGHGAFFGMGAYTTAILVSEHDWAHLATVPVAAVITLAAGFVVGLPALRIKGLYLALVTLAFATLFPVLIQKFSDVTGGTQGLSVPLLEAPESTGLANDQYIYYLQLAVLVAMLVLVRNLMSSRVGRGLIAIRDKDVAAEVVGVNVAAYRVGTFGLSAMLAGIGGSLWVLQNSFVSAGDFRITLSIEFLAAMVIGGATSLLGPILGSLFIEFVPEYTSDIDPQLSNVIYGCLLILLMLVLPGGIVGGIKRLEAFLLRKAGRTRDWRKAPDAAGPPPPDDVVGDALSG